MSPFLKEIRNKHLLWLLAFVPVALAVGKLAPGSHTLPFVMSVLAIVPLAALLSPETESVATRPTTRLAGSSTRRWET